MNKSEELGVVDWSKVPTDTKVYVSDDKEHWYPAHFFKCDKEFGEKHDNSPFKVFKKGTTSFTVQKSGNEPAIYYWKYCKLAEEQQ